MKWLSINDLSNAADDLQRRMDKKAEQEGEEIADALIGLLKPKERKPNMNWQEDRQEEQRNASDKPRNWGGRGW